jgi:hypothetical protein
MKSAEWTYNSLTNSLRVRLSIFEVITLAIFLNTDGSAVNESLTLAETGIVLLAATAKVAIGQAGDGASYKENQMNINCYKRRMSGRTWKGLTSNHGRCCSRESPNSGDKGQCEAHCKLLKSE